VKPLELLAAIQSIYFLATGIWPILHIESFMKVTGPKRNLWLVKTVGAIIISIGLSLAVAAWNHQINLAIVTLAITSAIALTCIDVIYVSKGTIAKIYLLDAAAEIVLILAWLIAWL
jgi:energy-converting hydrogenase Eha subunit E